MAKLSPIAPDLNTTSGFGNGLWIYDKYAAIGAPGCKGLIYLVVQVDFVPNRNGILSSAANNQTGAAYVYSINSTGSWSLNQRLICSYAPPTAAPSSRPPKRPSTTPSTSSTSSSPVSVIAGSVQYSAPCGSKATFGFKVGIYRNSSSNSFLIIGAPNYCNHSIPFF